MSKLNNNYSKSYNAGFRWGKKTIKENYYNYGDEALYKCDKAAETCRKYAEDKRISKTKKGRYLSPSVREYYKGIADGMLDGYNNL